ncbi:major capsid protein [Pasteurella phage vB_PmuP_PS07]|nr:major capsid protein [Pasteurella phage vB_PmuP_PS07]UIS74048.1 major capsid protein [Pasteurella phage vB_PmuP_PS30]
MGNVVGQQMGADNGKGQSASDKLALFLKVFGGEVITAFERNSVTNGRHIVRQISSGKSAQFPVLGRTSAHYLQAGESLDDKRVGIKHTERTITIDGLLTADVLIFDIEDAMNHFDVKSEYTKQLGESLAIAADGAVLAELAKACNLTTNDENITGLGAPSVLTIGASSSLDTPVKLGKAIIEYLTQARAKLTSNYVPSGDRVFYTTPDNYSAILAALMPDAANYQALINPETGAISNVMGFEVVEVPHLLAGGGSDDKIGTQTKHVFPASGGKVNKTNVVGLFHHRTAVGTVKLKDLALERARRSEYQADQIIAKYAIGHGYLRPEALGALVYSD